MMASVVAVVSWRSLVIISFVFFFFFQAEDGIRDLVSDWSSDVCSSDLEFHLNVADLRRRLPEFAIGNPSAALNNPVCGARKTPGRQQNVSRPEWEGGGRVAARLADRKSVV